MDEQQEARIVDAFRDALNVAVSLAGSPGGPWLVAYSRKHGPVVEGKIVPLRNSTIRDNLGKAGGRLPKWNSVVLPLITVLRKAIEREGGDPDIIGTVEQWRQWHADAAAAITLGHPDLAPSITLPGQIRTLAASARQGAAGAGLAGPADLWEEYHDAAPAGFRPYLDLETTCSFLRVYEPRLVPDLLQTPAYAYAVLRRALPDAPDEVIRRHVALRMRRFELLYRRADRPTGWFILEEDVFADPVVPSDVMADQCRHLLHLGRSTRLTIQVATSPDGEATLGSGPVTLLRFARAYRQDIVYLPAPASAGTAESGRFLYDEDSLAYFTAKFAAIGHAALKEDCTKRLLGHVGNL